MHVGFDPGAEGFNELQTNNAVMTVFYIFSLKMESLAQTRNGTCHV